MSAFLRIIGVMSLIGGVLFGFASALVPGGLLAGIASGIISAALFWAVASIIDGVRGTEESVEEAVEALHLIADALGAEKKVNIGEVAKCPKCGKKIISGVKICRHCLSRFDDESGKGPWRPASEIGE